MFFGAECNTLRHLSSRCDSAESSDGFESPEWGERVIHLSEGAVTKPLATNSRLVGWLVGCSTLQVPCCAGQ